MPTKNVVLTDHQAHFVENLVVSGRYQNASEVLREGLRLIELRESEDKFRLIALKKAARLGIADINAGASTKACCLLQKKTQAPTCLPTSWHLPSRYARTPA